jgi:hypothetical protein
MDEEFVFPPNGSIVKVESSNIGTMCYLSEGTGQLIVQFKKNKAVYRYHNMSPGTWEAVRIGRATKDGKKKNSVGAAFYQIVSSRPDLYPYEKWPWEEKDE